ncbi:aminomethyltransferase folate-binding domain protein [Mycobacterium kansasii]|uniref:Aminomethyltransferase folate-binding domain protein n=1 Tax=Mycobacterium kansasii TaxID=1768 RepID=A0A1V3X9B5_MYCKA|nr:aminomethyltransferase folate-binding domain protein [Mycobacterium kansasii]
MTAVPAPDPGPDAGAIWHYGDPLGEQRAAETESVFVDRSHRAVITLTGKDRQTWLHSISTQHVSDLPEGASTENLSLDGQGRVEDHWIQTELADTTYLDTEPWRGEPLLSYLRKMVFWAAVTPEAADLAVLSLLGPRLADRAVLDVVGLDALPSEMAAVPLAGGGFVRRMPAPAGQIELDLLVPREDCADWQHRLTQAGVRPAGVWTYEAHRVAARRPGWASTPTNERFPTKWAGSAGPGSGRTPGQRLLPRTRNRRAGAQPRQTAADAGAVASGRLGGSAVDR